MAESIITESPKNPYFIAFMKSNKLNIGSTFRGHEFIAWIMDRHYEFRQMHGLPDNIPYSKQWTQRFIEYLDYEIGGEG